MSLVSTVTIMQIHAINVQAADNPPLAHKVHHDPKEGCDDVYFQQEWEMHTLVISSNCNAEGQQRQSPVSHVDTKRQSETCSLP